MRLQEITKLLDGQPGVTHDTTEGKGVDRIMAWDCQNPRAIGHDDIFFLTSNGKSRLL